MKPSPLVLALFVLFFFPGKTILAGPSIAVITSVKSEIAPLTPQQIRAFFLLEKQFLDSGKLVEIGDRDRNSAIFKQFYQNVAAMTPKDVAIYWARKVFTGKAVPPKPIKGDDEAAKSWVKSTTHRLTFIEAKNVDSTIKVIGTVNPDAGESR